MLYHVRILVTLVFLGIVQFSTLRADPPDVKTIRIDGSSTVYPIVQAAGEEFQKKNRTYKVRVGIAGTGGGFKKLVAGEIDICNASRKIRPTEIQACKNAGLKYVELPIAYDALCIVIHPKNTWCKQLTLAELQAIFKKSSKIQTWSDVRKEWPNKKIDFHGSDKDSGAYDFFYFAVLNKKGIRKDYRGVVDDNLLVRSVSQNRFAIGILSLAYYEVNKDKLKVLAISSGKAKPAAPTAKSIVDGSYPLARSLYLYVNRKSLRKDGIVSFLNDILSDRYQKLVRKTGYTPLSKKQAATIRLRLEDAED
ncbi:MAG: PstS family phosphate ABC transporter substrate-binding protein [Planctomycetaceae bacterium]